MTLQITRTGHFYKPFLAELSKSANVKDACAAAGISRQAAYQARDKDEQFRIAWAEAVDDAVDGLKQIAWERAREKSDLLLMRIIGVHDKSWRDGPSTTVSVSNQTQIANVKPEPKTLVESVRILVESGAIKLEDIMPKAIDANPNV